MMTATRCYPKIIIKEGNVFFGFLKAKTDKSSKINSKNYFCIVYVDQKPFWPFLENIYNLLFDNCYLMYKEGFWKFSKNILIFKTLVIF